MTEDEVALVQLCRYIEHLTNEGEELQKNLLTHIGEVVRADGVKDSSEETLR